TFGNENGELGGGARVLGTVDHMGETRMERQVGERPTLAGHAACRVQSVELLEQRYSLDPGRFRRRIEETKRGRITDAPAREIEHEAAQIGAEDFGRIEGGERAGLAFGPEAIADARAEAAGTTAALVGSSARDTAGFERSEACRRVVGGHAGETGIDDYRDALDGERGLGDGGGEHDLAASGGRRGDGAILFRGVELAVERGEIDVDREARGEPLGGAGDFGLAGKKDEHRAWFGPQRGEDGGGHLVLEALQRI